MRYGPIDIFRAGSWTDMGGRKAEFTEAQLQEIAAGYDPEDAPAPAVIGHPQNDAPAYAWVERVYVEGGKLKAILAEAAAEFVEWVKTGRYKKISVALYQPDAANNPTPGKWSLKHVGFLGGAAPAVSGLEPVGFTDSSGAALVFAEDSLFAERAAISREREEMRLEKLIAEGHILPRERAELLTFMGSLDGEATFAFADGKRQTPREWFASWLQSRPKIVDFSALPREDDLTSAHGTRHFNAPAGHIVDREGMALFDQATALAETSGVTFAEAVLRLSRGR